MDEVKKVELPSGAELTITLAPFKDGKALYQAIAEELKAIDVEFDDDIDANFMKNLFCVGISSKKIEAALEPCLKRVLYNGLKIDDKTFEPANARQDYIPAMFEVAKENVLPFAKSLYAKYETVLSILKAPSSDPS